MQVIATQRFMNNAAEVCYLSGAVCVRCCDTCDGVSGMLEPCCDTCDGVSGMLEPLQLSLNCVG